MRGDRTEPTPEIAIDDIIQRERRVLPAISFAIFADLLGARTVLASALESGLPEVPLEAWLNGLFASVPGATPVDFTSWIFEFCEPEETALFVGGLLLPGSPHVARRRTRAICMNMLTGLDDDRLLSMRVRVGTVKEDAGAWSPEHPSIYDISIGASGKVIDVPFLSMLPSFITLATAAWPVMDVSIQPQDIRYEPADAKVGNPITITGVVRNIGERDARFISGILGLMSCCDAKAAFREFLGDIPAHGTLTISLSTTMPPWGSIGMTVLPLPANLIMRQGPYGRLHDANSENNLVEIQIGTPPSKTFPR